MLQPTPSTSLPLPLSPHPHTRLYFPLPYTLHTPFPASLLVCWHANFNVCKSYASRGALAVAVATPTSLAPPHLHTRAVHTYVKRTPLPTSTSLHLSPGNLILFARIKSLPQKFVRRPRVGFLKTLYKFYAFTPIC